MATTPRQLPLALQLRDNALLENFIATGNETLLHTLCDNRETYLYLWGELASGKTHLLQALCHQSAANGQSVAYLPLGEEDIIDPAILDGLEAIELVCLDNIDFIVGNKAWETALFNLINRIRNTPHRLVIAGQSAPGKLGIQLADLESRLNWGAIFQVVTLKDNDKLQFLKQRAAQRGLELGDDVAAFLLKRYPRDMASLFELLDKLDQASMVAKRKLTIPFVREFL